MPVQRTVSPIDGRLVAERELADAAAVARALERAGAAFPRWRATPVAERCALLSRAVDALVARRDVIAREITWQMGRPIAHSPGEIRGLRGARPLHAGAAPEALADSSRSRKPGFTRFIRHEPLGAGVRRGALELSLPDRRQRIIPALAAGNVVLLKHSAQTPLFAERFQRGFDAAGLPPGVFQHLHLSHDAACGWSPAARRPGRFTGSVARRPRGPGGRGAALHRHQSRARRQRPGLCPRGCRPRPRGREPGRRRVLQLRPELLRHRADLRPRAPSSTTSSTAMSSSPRSYVLGDPPEPARRWARWSARRPPTSPAAKSTRRWRRARTR